jgi:hypothetical protein
MSTLADRLDAMDGVLARLLAYQEADRAELLDRVETLGARSKELYRKGYEAGYKARCRKDRGAFGAIAPTITDEMVERVAQALYEVVPGELRWHQVAQQEYAENYRRDARAALSSMHLEGCGEQDG